MDYASIVGLVTFAVMMIMVFAGIPVFVSMLASAFGGFIALYFIRNREENKAAEKAEKDGDDNHANEA